ncbi:hypothetical protein D3C71_1119490 [compost metagenome]
MQLAFHIGLPKGGDDPFQILISACRLGGVVGRCLQHPVIGIQSEVLGLDKGGGDLVELERGLLVELPQPGQCLLATSRTAFHTLERYAQTLDLVSRSDHPGSAGNQLVKAEIGCSNTGDLARQGSPSLLTALNCFMQLLGVLLCLLGFLAVCLHAGGSGAQLPCLSGKLALQVRHLSPSLLAGGFNPLLLAGQLAGVDPSFGQGAAQPIERGVLPLILAIKRLHFPASRVELPGLLTQRLLAGVQAVLEGIGVARALFVLLPQQANLITRILECLALLLGDAVGLAVGLTQQIHLGLGFCMSARQPLSLLPIGTVGGIGRRQLFLGICQCLAHAGSTGAGSLEPLPQIGSAALEIGELGQGCVLLTEPLQLIAQGADLFAARFGLTTQGIHLGDELADLGQPLNGGADPQLDIGIVAGHGDSSEMKKPAGAGL